MQEKKRIWKGGKLLQMWSEQQAEKQPEKVVEERKKCLKEEVGRDR